MTEPEQIADLKQQVFKLKSDIDFVRFENAEKDIKFLKEMKEHAIRAYDERDAASHEMVLTMISDWIHQLEKFMTEPIDEYYYLKPIEPDIDKATKDLIEEDAEHMADSFDKRGTGAHQGYRRGYIRGATVWAEKLKQLETRLDFDVKMGIADSLIEKFESLKDKSHE